ncbi:MarR family winged helix-turn-helix transcriptional regulator [Konateibacter massiliensis]|uniref:MarR family winged helix-turn-helix transcriptional regulator n=1 Tax=Konateibacter massiliensis TaxID=2002841 RepID=UPI000C160463|nr:MarR family transcriptional regulator [Konateibacter massiliensis]
MEYVKIIRSFGILNRTFLSYISKALSDKELSYSDSVFLVNIGENEGTTQEEIASALAIDKAAIARSVKSMVKSGYIRAEQSKSDKRAKALYLTDSGRELYRFMQELNRKWVDYVLSDFNSADIDSFSQTINSISEKSKHFHN